MLTNSRVGRFVVVLVSALAVLAALLPAGIGRAPAALAAEVLPMAGQYVPVAKSRILDTGSGAAAGTTTFAATGRAGVPDVSQVAAVALQVTVYRPSTSGTATVWTPGETREGFTVTYAAGQDRTNATVVKPDAQGRVSIHAPTAVRTLVDVVGYYKSSGSTTPGSRYVPVTPVRALSTTAAAQASTTVSTAGKGGVPGKGVTAVTVHLTTASSPSAGALTAWETGLTRETTPTLYYPATRSSTTPVTVPVNELGQFSVYNSSQTRIIADITGYYISPDTESAGSSFEALKSTRIHDSGTTTLLGPATTRAVRVTGVGGVPSSGVSSVLLQVTAIRPDAGGYLTVYPAGATKPGVSTSNYVPDLTDTSFTSAQVGANGQINIWNSAGNYRLLVEVVGYFKGAALPSVVRDVVATPGDTTVDLSWRAPALDGGAPVTSYRITEHPSGRVTTTTGTSTRVTGLKNGTTYNFSVEAVNAMGSGPSPLPRDVTPTGSRQGSVTGIVFEDVDGDGRRGANENGSPALEVTLTSTSGVTESSYTDPFGQYQFFALPGGAYDLTVKAPAGYASPGGLTKRVNVSGSDPNASNELSHPLTYSAPSTPRVAGTTDAPEAEAPAQPAAETVQPAAEPQESAPTSEPAPLSAEQEAAAEQKAADAPDSDPVAQPQSSDVMAISETPSGTISSAGPLGTIYTSPSLQCELYYRSQSHGAYFLENACSTVVRVGGTTYGYTYNFGSTALTPVSQDSSGSGTARDPYVVTTTSAAGSTGVRLVQKDSYVPGSNSYRTDVEVVNTGASPQSVRVYRAADCYFDGDDYGRGHYDATTGAVSCASVSSDGPNGSVGFLSWTPLSPGSTYFEGFYGDVWRAVSAGGALPNTVVTDTHDNGAALSWAMAVPAGERTTRSFLTSALPAGSRAYELPPVPKEQTFGSAATDGCYCPSTTRPVLDPIDSATGAFTESFTDLLLPSSGVPAAVMRTYTSQDPSRGSFGRGWSFGLDARLALAADSIRFKAENGQEIVYTRATDGTWVTPPGVFADLTKTSSGYRITDDALNTLDFDAAGKLVAKKTRQGEGITLTYQNGTLSKVTDSAGRSITFTYQNGRITRATGPDGRFVSYGYSGDLLTSYTDRGADTTTYSYDNLGRMVSAIDPRGARMFSNVYDANGRVVEQTDAGGGVSRVDWDPATQTAVVTDADGQAWSYVYRSNVLLETTDPLGRTTSYNYNSDLRLEEVIDPMGRLQGTYYDESGNLRARLVEDAEEFTASTESWTHNSTRQILTHTDPLDNTTSFSYDGLGRLSTVTSPTGAETSYQYLRGTLVSSITDPLGRVTRYEYNAAGDRTAVVSPGGQRSEFSYDASGRVSSSVDPRGTVAGATRSTFTTTYSYSDDDEVLSVSAPGGRTTRFTYDEISNVLTSVTPTGETTTTTYDALSRPTKVVLPGNRTLTTTYDVLNRVTAQRTPSGTTTYAYDEVGNVVAETSPRGNTLAGAPLADAEAFTTRYTYDDADRVIVTTREGRADVVTEYDALDNPVVVTRDPNGPNEATVTSNYDPASRVESISDPRGATTDFSYDESGRLTHTTDALGNVSETVYDAAGQVVESWAPGRSAARFSYDADGRMSSYTDPRGDGLMADPEEFTSHYRYDPLGMLVESEDPLGAVTRQSYDAAGNLASVTDARGGKTEYSYDASGRPLSVTTPAPHGSGMTRATTSFTYANGDLVKRTDALGRETTYSYDASGQLTSERTPGGKVTTYSYDAHGNTTRVVRPSGNATATSGDGQIDYTYDPYDQLTGITYSDGTPSVKYAYDSAGRRSTRNDGTGSTSYTYDEADNLTSVFRAAAGSRASSLVGYEYDPLGRQKAVSYPSGAQSTFAYRGDGLLESVTTGAGVSSYDYDEAGNLTSATYPGTTGVSTTSTWDAAGRMSATSTRKGTATVHALTREFDAVGNPTTTTTTDALGRTSTEKHYYDANNMLQAWSVTPPGATSPARSNSLSYDAVGNITSLSATPCEAQCMPTDKVFSYDADDQLTRVAGAADATFSYDANGNETRAGGRVSEYNLAGDLVRATLNHQSIDYSYDGDGNRIETRVNGSLTATSVWDETAPNAALLSTTTTGASAAVTTDVLYGHGMLGTATSGTTSFSVTDPLGSVVARFDQAGKTLGASSYDPWGRANNSSPSAPTASPLGFTGEAFAPETGLTDLRARQYDSALMRFTGVDPVARGAGQPYLNAYNYADNRPTLMVDPSGMVPQWAKDVTRGVGDAAWEIGPGLVGTAAHFGAKAYAYTPPALLLEAMGYEDPTIKMLNGVSDGIESAHAWLQDWGGGCTDSLAYKGAYGGASAASFFIPGAGAASKAGKAAGAVERGVGKATTSASRPLSSTPASQAVSRSQAGAAPRASKDRAESAAASCSLHSFAGSTLVLMADGSRKHIDQVELGDEVLATDPETGESSAREVTKLHVNVDEELTDLVLRNEQGVLEQIKTTPNHPFWDATADRWVGAGELMAGDVLLSADGSRLQVVAGTSRSGTSTMYDLTVAGVHTYHVGDADVLVHNCGDELVYHAYHSDGSLEYVGITNDFERRASEHLRDSGRIIVRSKYQNLSHDAARGIEQRTIEDNGLSKNGGTLSNKINSIAQTNPKYKTRTTLADKLMGAK